MHENQNEIERLRNLVFEKTKMKIDAEDPLLQMLVLNQHLLSESVAAAFKPADRLAADLAEAVARFGERIAPETIDAQVQKVIQQRQQEAIERIEDAAVAAVKVALKNELADLKAATARAARQNSAAQGETRKWVLAVAVIAGFIGSATMLIAAKYLHFIY